MKVKLPSLACRVPEIGVFGCLPIGVLSLVIVLFCAFFPHWMESSLTEIEITNTSVPIIVSNIYVGIFSIPQIPGSKTRESGGACVRPLSWVCDQGYCMLSCGETSSLREEDIQEILSGNYTHARGDDQFCSPCSQEEELTRRKISSSTTSISPYHTTVRENESPSSVMTRQSMLIAVRVFLVLGLVFTFVNIVFNAVNIILTPVSAIVGIDGLVLWNTIAATSYLLTLLLWGAEYNMKLRRNPGVSDSLRKDTSPGGWSVDSRMGWCCLLLILPLFLHILLALNLGHRQWVRYYSSHRREEAQARRNVMEKTQGGTDILF